MIRIILGDITEVKDVDVIVNSANSSLRGGGGVDGAIHYKAGRELREECITLKGCKVGEAKITKGYNLGIPYVIHTVGPVYYFDKNPPLKLKESYLNSLLLAKEHGLNKIAFSAISTGIYGYPINEACEIALSTVLEFYSKNNDFEISFVLFDNELYNLYLDKINEIYPHLEFTTKVLEKKIHHFGSLEESLKSFRDKSTQDEVCTKEKSMSIKDRILKFINYKK